MTLETDVAVLRAQSEAHNKLDDERFGRIAADISHIKNGQQQIAQTYQSGIARVHEKIEEVSNENIALKGAVDGIADQARAAIREGLQGQKIWILTQAMIVGSAIITFIVKEFLLKH